MAEILWHAHLGRNPRNVSKTRFSPIHFASKPRQMNHFGSVKKTGDRGEQHEGHRPIAQIHPNVSLLTKSRSNWIDIEVYIRLISVLTRLILTRVPESLEPPGKKIEGKLGVITPSWHEAANTPPATQNVQAAARIRGQNRMIFPRILPSRPSRG